jgi:hypothetical protein
MHTILRSRHYDGEIGLLPISSGLRLQPLHSNSIHRHLSCGILYIDDYHIQHTNLRLLPRG